MKLSETELYNFIQSVMGVTDFDETPKYFQARINLANEEFLQNVHLPRTIKAPAILNDLGVRKAESPLEAYRYVRKMHNSLPENLDYILQADFPKIDLDTVSIYLDMYVLISGDFDGAYTETLKRIPELLKLTDYRSLILVGSLFAAESDAHAVDFFDLASNNTDRVEQRIVALHRKEAYLLKRTENWKNSLVGFDQLLGGIDQLPSGWRKNVYMALADNLYALYIVMQNSKDSLVTAKYLLTNAGILIDELSKIDGYDPNDQLADEAYRYRSQVEMNMAQLLVEQHKKSDALLLLQSNAQFVQKYSPNYEAEAQATLGYLYYLNDKYASAVSSYQNAIAQYESDGAFHESEHVKKLLIAAFYKNGQKTQAEKMYSEIK
ncbi:Hypothetical protein LROSL1_2314 [Furfurilactobacillus rossiae]|uniref:tetratricopeptide repeat protein n=1 Tax=Furfurilactobacillus rossiae TaxID=231049 RepID=UPI0015BB6B8D|nr:hypothetical protein [Furfurilactobacillus rossiae]MCF6166316.1 hypothetical protein [Furfurilactobacillus rossiae]QLE65115.1 Hypothetical protein LROSL1_2314 [Furfurilactobacillus rossiae]